ncbi:MAG: PRC-barrel domain-containing protein [Anaerolineales bacterium]
MYVLVNPVAEKVTHMVVREDASPNTEYIVPVETVSATIVDTIQLRCSKAELKKMNHFIQTEFVEEKVPSSGFLAGNGMYGMGSYYYLPYVTSDGKAYESVRTQQIPPGELAVHRGTRVEAKDGYVGKVDEFVVNKKNGNITHLVMREGHPWGRKDVIIPLSAMDKTLDGTMFLTLNKHEIESLPTFPMHRRWS